MFEELRGRALERAAKEEKRRKQAREDFSALLRHTRGVEADTPWDEAEALLLNEPEYKQVRAWAWLCCCSMGRCRVMGC